MTARLIEEPRGGRHRSTTLVRSLWPCKKALKRNSHVGQRGGGGFISRWCEREREWWEDACLWACPTNLNALLLVLRYLSLLTSSFLFVFNSAVFFLRRRTNFISLGLFIFSFFAITIIGILLNKFYYSLLKHFWIYLWSFYKNL